MSSPLAPGYGGRSRPGNSSLYLRHITVRVMTTLLRSIRRLRFAAASSPGRRGPGAAGWRGYTRASRPRPRDGRTPRPGPTKVR
nr:hypothetical protein [Tanacetum cinerariifolium]